MPSNWFGFGLKTAVRLMYMMIAINLHILDSTWPKLCLLEGRKANKPLRGTTLVLIQKFSDCFSFLQQNKHCMVPENIHTPPWRVTEGVGGSERGNFPKGRGVQMEFFFR